MIGELYIKIKLFLLKLAKVSLVSSAFRVFFFFFYRQAFFFSYLENYKPSPSSSQPSAMLTQRVPPLPSVTGGCKWICLTCQEELAIGELKCNNYKRYLVFFFLTPLPVFTRKIIFLFRDTTSKTRLKFYFCVCPYRQECRNLRRKLR